MHKKHNIVMVVATLTAVFTCVGPAHAESPRLERLREAQQTGWELSDQQKDLLIRLQGELNVTGEEKQKESLLTVRQRSAETDIVRRARLRREQRQARANIRISRQREPVVIQTTYDEELLQLFNAERRKAGLVALSLQSKLSDAAVLRLKDYLAGKVDLNEDDLGDFLKKSGYILSPETCNCYSYQVESSFLRFEGSGIPQHVVTTFMSSDSTKDVILSNQFAHIGIAKKDKLWFVVFSKVTYEKRIRVVGAQREAFRREVLDLVNIERKKENLSILAYDTNLEQVAQAHTENMDRNNFYDHIDPQGRSPIERATAMQYTPPGKPLHLFGENIARGHYTPKEVVQAWMDSPEHKENILHEQFTHLGVGIEGDYWAQNFSG